MYASTLALALTGFGSFTMAACANLSTKYLISFGDSYSQTGFDINGAQPSASNPLGNPSLPGWTASGGLDWVGFMVTEFNSSLTLSYNFASGGATVDSDLIAPYAPTVKSLIEQVQQFSDSITDKPSTAPWTAENAVFGIWMGVNDVGNSFWLDNVTDLLDAVLDKYIDQIEILYQAGARQFAVLTVPPMDKTPAFSQKDDWSLEHIRSTLDFFNENLASRIAEFQASHEEAIIKVVDTSVPFDEAIENPTKYGAPDATCFNGDGKSCLWFNDYHPGISIQRLVAAEIAKAWSGFFKS